MTIQYTIRTSDREYVLTKHFCRHTIIVGARGELHGQSSLSAKRRGKQVNVLFGGREEKLTTVCVYLVQRTMYDAAWLVQQWSVQ